MPTPPKPAQSAPSEAPSIIAELVERFSANAETYLSGTYNEETTCLEFILPFFKALGWDVTNEAGDADAYKDLIHRDSIKVGGATEAPDYCFRIGPARKFFVEAKRAGENVVSAPRPAYQLRRYAWSAKLPLSILTNFAEFAVYDCRLKPASGDPASKGRILSVGFKDYVARWGEIAAIFSKEAVRKGSFDRYAASTKGKRGTAEVDDAFLEEIEAWRDELARNVALRNGSLTQRQLNEAVGRTIDRIVFLRMCEDRGIETYGRLQALMNGQNVYARLCELFKTADDRYNSGLFHFRQEEGRSEPPDDLALELAVDDSVLKDVVRGLYYPDSPYEFSVLPADILGHVYERFLGKVIRLTPAHRAVVEDKPEVRKAGGVYYTPTYIVEYIVKQTVGKLLEGKTPRQVAGVGRGARPLRVLDPACGSGSFLLGAYQHLLDWHRDWYVANVVPLRKAGKAATSPELRRLIVPRKGKVPLPVYQGAGGEWRLTTAERKRILLQSIYGVDIDPQAVEVTKLSLLLKVLEGETQGTLQSMLIHKERALPDLGDNIKCGNSLVGPDFFRNHQCSLFDEEERYRINAFDWKAEFPQVFAGKRPGFDAVIGNPPYGQTLAEAERLYLDSRYPVFASQRDAYVCFVEAGLPRLTDEGMMAMITPSAWLGGPRYEALRRSLLSLTLERLVLLPFDVFAEAYVDTVVFVLKKTAASSTHQVQTFVYPKREQLGAIGLEDADYAHVRQSGWRANPDAKFVLDPFVVRLVAGIRRRWKQTLGDFVSAKRGVLLDPALLTKKPESAASLRYFEGDVYRYQLIPRGERWLTVDSRVKERPREQRWFTEPRILLRRLVSRQRRLMATVAGEPLVTNKNIYSILPTIPSTDLHVVLTVLNSRLASFLYVQQVTQAAKDDFPQVTIRDLLSLPCPSVPPALSGSLRSMAEQMLRLQEQVRVSRTNAQRAQLARHIDAVDRQIDELVYELYGLTTEEKALVEGG